MNLSNLETNERFKECLYHLKEIADSQQAVAALLLRLDESFDRDPSRAAKHLAFLRVEIYTHLLKHIQAARLPLMGLIREVYSGLGEEAPASPEDGASGE